MGLPGGLLLWATALASLAATGVSGLAWHGGRRSASGGAVRLARVGRRLIVVTALLATITTGVLGWALVHSDLTLAYVADHSRRGVSAPYRLAGLWGGMAGSLLFWTALLATVSAVGVTVGRRSGRAADVTPRADPSTPPDPAPALIQTVLGAVVAAFTLTTLALANPFDQLGIPAVDGGGLTPILEHPAMLYHPPLLYLGLVTLAVPYARTLAALVHPAAAAPLAPTIRRWMLASWVLLAVGMVSGANWAYVEVGWGGYWAWDPVENAALLPWLAITAFLHAGLRSPTPDPTATDPRRSALPSALVILAFVLATMGTLLTRSGAASSVHAFAQATAVGRALLGLVIAVAAGGLGALLVHRRRATASTTTTPDPRNTATTAAPTRPTPAPLNPAATTATTIHPAPAPLNPAPATLARSTPAALNATGTTTPAHRTPTPVDAAATSPSPAPLDTATLAAPTSPAPARVDARFVLTRDGLLGLQTVLVVGAIALVVIGMLAPLVIEWRTGNESVVDGSFYAGTIAPIAILLLLLTGIGPRLGTAPMPAGALLRDTAVPLVGGGAAAVLFAWAGWSDPTTLALAAAAGFAATSAVQLGRRSRRGVTAHVAHFGFALLLLGIAGSTAATERTVPLGPGRTLILSDLEILSEGASTEAGPPPRVVAPVVVTRGGVSRRLVPSIDGYPERGTILPETSLWSTPIGDVQVALRHATDNGNAVFDVRVRPLAPLVWWGGLVLVAAGGMALVQSGFGGGAGGSPEVSGRPLRLRSRRRLSVGGGPAGGAAARDAASVEAASRSR